MSLFAGLDISVKTTAICVVDTDGHVLLETSVDSAPRGNSRAAGCGWSALSSVSDWRQDPSRSGFMPVSSRLALPAICVETRHMHAALSARINKTDRNDARGIAQMMRVGLFKPVHVKTPASQHRRLLLTSRKLLQRKIYDIENDLRGSAAQFRPEGRGRGWPSASSIASVNSLLDHAVSLPPS